jgi:maleate cis-trans isomerase
MTKRLHRISQMVPSSNTTMETEIPAMLNAHALAHGTRFTFHSRRMRMKTVKKEEFAAMDAESDRCAPAEVEARTGKSVVTAAVATICAVLKVLDSERRVPGAGALLSGAY